MVQKNTLLSVSDRCGVWFVNTFHLYQGYNRKVSFIGNFIKVSIRKTKPNNWLKKKTKVKAFIVRSKIFSSKYDGSYVKFNTNTCLLLKKRLTPYGKKLFGPTLKKIKRKKFLSSFSGIL